MCLFRYSLVLNKRVGPNSRVGGKFSKNLINRGFQMSGGRVKLGNLYLKIRYRIIFFMLIPKLIHSFSTSI